MSKEIGQPLVIVNKGGGSGIPKWEAGTRLRPGLQRPKWNRCLLALMPVVYALLKLPLWTRDVQRQAGIAALALMAVAAVALLHRKGDRRYLFPAAVWLGLCRLMEGSVTYLSQSINTGRWFEGLQREDLFRIFPRPTWGTAAEAAVLAAAWIALCCLTLRREKAPVTEQSEEI